MADTYADIAERYNALPASLELWFKHKDAEGVRAMTEFLREDVPKLFEMVK